MTSLREAAQQALEALYRAREFTELYDTEHAASVNEQCHDTIAALRTALKEPQQDPELSAALGWVGGISEPLLDRKALLRRVAEIATDSQAKTKRAWDVGYDCGIRAAKEFAAERRLTDAEIGKIWFEAKIPGMTETQARLLIRAAERRLLEGE